MLHRKGPALPNLALSKAMSGIEQTLRRALGESPGAESMSSTVLVE
jgi:hypothetical protein